MTLSQRYLKAVKFDKDKQTALCNMLEALWENVDRVNDAFEGARIESDRREPIDQAIARVLEAAEGILWVNDCKCDEAWTARGRHEPNARCGEMDLFVDALKGLKEVLR